MILFLGYLFSFLCFFSIYIHIIINTSTYYYLVLFYINSLVINFFSLLYILLQILLNKAETYHHGHMILLSILNSFFQIAQILPFMGHRRGRRCRRCCLLRCHHHHCFAVYRCTDYCWLLVELSWVGGGTPPL